jgi:hypothetical protein
MRPATSCAIVVAVPDTSKPPRNNAMPVVSGKRGPRVSLSPPEATMPTTLAMRNPVNAQPNAARPCRSRAAVGRAAVTAMASNAISVIRMSRPVLSARTLAEKIEAGARTSRSSRPA